MVNFLVLSLELTRTSTNLALRAQLDDKSSTVSTNSMDPNLVPCGIPLLRYSGGEVEGESLKRGPVRRGGGGFLVGRF